MFSYSCALASCSFSPYLLFLHLLISCLPAVTFVGVIIDGCLIPEEPYVIRVTSICVTGHEMSDESTDGWIIEG